MIIDLASPLWGGIAAGIILMIIAGTYHYIRTLVQLNFTEKKLSNILSEMDSLHTEYKKQIAGINKIQKIESDKAIEDIRKLYDKKLEEILKHNQPPTGRKLMDRSKLEEILTKKPS